MKLAFEARPTEVANRGRLHYERRISQQRAADKRRVKRKSDIDWRKEQQ